MVTTVFKASFNGSQSLIIILSRFFLTFTIACVGSYSREYFTILTGRTHKTTTFKKILITSIVPSLLAITFFDGIVNTLNLGAILLFSFVSGFLGFDILKDMKKMGTIGVWKLVSASFGKIYLSTVLNVISDIMTAWNMVKKTIRSGEKKDEITKKEDQNDDIEQ